MSVAIGGGAVSTFRDRICRGLENEGKACLAAAERGDRVVWRGG